MALAQPVSKDGFYYAGDSIYVEASGHNRHRRATLPELNALFHPKSAAESSKDPVGHWYEAQLLHYGLPPSKNKAVAKSRLLDAVNSGTLSIPTAIQKLEKDLKMKWAKRERDAKAELKRTAGETSKGTKRKVDTSVAKSVPRKKSKPMPVKAVASAVASAAAKPRRTTASPKKEPAKKVQMKKETATTSPSIPKQTAKRGGIAAAPKTELASKVPAIKRQTASRGGSSLRGQHSTMVGANSSSPASAVRIKQTARYSGRGRGGSNLGAPGRLAPAFPIEESPNFQDFQEDSDVQRNYDHSYDSHPPPYDSVSPTLYGTLGLLNGRYELQSEDMDQWDQWPSEDFNLILTLEGDRLWGAYDFGSYSGILNMARPYGASLDKIPFKWRGRENGEGEMSFSDRNEGWVQFLGGGRIEGMISCYGYARFRGIRVSGAQMRSERTAVSMRQEWDGYNMHAYEYASVFRWH
jgi:hypothetical protein